MNNDLMVSIADVFHSDNTTAKNFYKLSRSLSDSLCVACALDKDYLFAAQVRDNSIDIKIPTKSLENFEGVVPLQLITSTGAIYMSIADNAFQRGGRK